MMHFGLDKVYNSHGIKVLVNSIGDLGSQIFEKQHTAILVRLQVELRSL